MVSKLPLEHYFFAMNASPLKQSIRSAYYAPKFLLNRPNIFLCDFKNWDITPLLALHWCLAANLRNGIFNGEMVFNRLLGNCWSDFDDFFGRPPWNFYSDEMLKKACLCARAHKFRITRTADIGQFWPIFAQNVLRFFWAEIFNFEWKHLKLSGIHQQR